MEVKQKYIPFVNSLPKSGTNLLQKVIELMGYKYAKPGIAESLILGEYYIARQLLRGAMFDKSPITIGLSAPVPVNRTWLDSQFKQLTAKQYISGHTLYTEQLYQLLLKYHIKPIIIIRDPRDVLISWTHYIIAQEHYVSPDYKNKSFDERMQMIISGGYLPRTKVYINSFNDILQSVDNWLQKADVLVIKYEDLVGEKGGGTNERQTQAIKSIAHYLGLTISNDNLNRIIANSYGGTHTFRNGKINNWVHEHEDTISYFDKIHLFIGKWGYFENDFPS